MPPEVPPEVPLEENLNKISYTYITHILTNIQIRIFTLLRVRRKVMGTLLSKYAISRDNNFNLVRFIAAFLVLYSHSFLIALGSGDAEPLKSMLGMSLGRIAVDIFFITSGFLITSSYISRNNLIAFAWARILRIYPALIMAMIFCVFIVGLWFTTSNTWEYLLNTQTHKFILKNTVIFLNIEYQLPGVFNDNPWTNMVNGSLWTLPYEVKMYVILPFILSIIVYVRKWISFVTIKNALFSIVLLSIIINITAHFQPIYGRQLFFRLFYMFFIGAAFYVWRDRIRLSSGWFFIVLSLLLLSTINKDVYFVFYYLLLPYLIFYVAYVPSGLVRKFNGIGDYSYGMYIYGFPVQQSMAAIIPDISVNIMITYSFIITLVLSVFSWHLIEKRCLSMKGSYIYIEKFLQKIGLRRHCTLRK